MRHVKTFSLSLFDPLVVVTMMTTVALILGLLAYASPTPSRKVVALCLVIGIIGLVTIVLQVRAILKRDNIREKLGEFLEQGKGLIQLCEKEIDPPPAREVEEWNQTVGHWLMTTLGKAYALRFSSAGKFANMSFNGFTSDKHQRLHKAVHLRVANLEKFISEMGI